MNEAQTRLELIDPSIRAAGWMAANGCRILVEQSACEFAPGRVGKVRGKPLRADYILTYRGRRLVVVEAKSDECRAIEGYEQALKYGRHLQSCGRLREQHPCKVLQREPRQGKQDDCSRVEAPWSQAKMVYVTNAP